MAALGTDYVTQKENLNLLLLTECCGKISFVVPQITTILFANFQFRQVLLSLNNHMLHILTNRSIQVHKPLH